MNTKYIFQPLNSKLLLLSILLSSLLALYGCGGSGGGSSRSLPTPTPDEKLAIEYPTVSGAFREVSDILQSDEVASVTKAASFSEYIDDDFKDLDNKPLSSEGFQTKIDNILRDYDIIKFEFIPTGHKIEDDLLVVTTYIDVKLKKSTGSSTIETTKSFDIKWEKQPDDTWKIIGGLPTTREQLGL